MATKVRWFAVACVVAGALLQYYSQSDDLQFLLGILLMAAGVLAFVMSFAVRWDSLTSSPPSATAPVLCPRGTKCVTGWDARTSECVLKSRSAAIPDWAEDRMDPTLMLDLETRGIWQLGVEYETYECPACGTDVLYLVHHGEPVEGRVKIAVRTAPGIYD